MTDSQLSAMINNYQELACMCDRLGFMQAARVWRYRASVLLDREHPTTKSLLNNIEKEIDNE